MTKFRFFCYKNKELILCIICFVSHAVFAPVFRVQGFNSLFLYNSIAASIYGILIILFTNRRRQFFFTVIFIEVIFYSILLTFITGHDFGTLMFSVSMIPVIFFISSREREARKTTFFLQTLIATVASVIIIIRDYGYTSAFYIDFPAAVTTHRIFYIMHMIFSTAISFGFIFYMSIVTEFDLKRIESKTARHISDLEYIANHDQLTGLMNRHRIKYYFNISETKKKNDGKDFALSIVDIDHFKKVNDNYGHDAGDYILRRTTKIIKSLLPENSKIARWGGEEFIILFNEYSDDIESVLTGIKDKVEKTDNIWNGINIPVTLTFGLSSSRQIDNIDHIITDADNMLFYGKENGRNRVVVSDKF